VPRIYGTVKFAVAGDAETCTQSVRDEVYRIDMKQYRQFRQHSSATRWRSELKYSQELTLRVQ